jgi:hypothetical protein
MIHPVRLRHGMMDTPDASLQPSAELQRWHPFPANYAFFEIRIDAISKSQYRPAAFTSPRASGPRSVDQLSPRSRIPCAKSESVRHPGSWDLGCVRVALPSRELPPWISQVRNDDRRRRPFRKPKFVKGIPMKQLTSLLIAFSAITAIGGCCGYNRCCNPCGCGPNGIQGFGTYGGYGTQFGQVSPSSSLATPAAIQPTISTAPPVATINQASYSSYAAAPSGVTTAAYPPTYPMPVAPATAMLPLDPLPTY